MSAVRERIDAAYKAFGQGDLPGLMALCEDDIVFSLPGNSLYEPSYTKETFFNLVMVAMGTSDGTFKEEIVDILEGEKYVAVLLDHSLTRGGEDIAYRTTHFWGIGDNGFTSWREVPDDLHVFEYAWRKE